MNEQCEIHALKIDWLIRGLIAMFTFLSILFAGIFGYFEMRIYPEVKISQNDVKELRKEMYLYMRDTNKTKTVCFTNGD